MAATAHSDPYSIFIRKIGYSVGLEHTLKRLTELEQLYRSNEELTLATWKNLVESKDKWGLKTDHIADTYCSLRFIQKITGDILVLENLDSMSITCKLLEKESERETARSFIFLWAILVNDGELFMNLLLSDFNPSQIKKKLNQLRNYKISHLREKLRGKESMRRILRTITFEHQEKNKGGAGIGKSVTSLRRTEPLLQKRHSNGGGTPPKTIQLSDDYFRKVPPRRKDWARSLGLWNDNEGLTFKGRRFKHTLIQSGYISTNDNVFTFWPMDYELIRSGFRCGPTNQYEKSLGNSH